MADTTKKTAFAHENPKTEVNPVIDASNKPSKWTTSRIIGIVLALIGLFLLYVLNRPTLEARQAERNVVRNTTVPPEETSLGRQMDLSTTAWTAGITCTDPTKKITGMILADDAWWLLMLDGDTNKIYTNYPANWKPETMDGKPNLLHVPPATMHQWALDPGHPSPTKTGKVIAKIMPE